MAILLPKRKASFLWQAALILLPLVVLVIVGAFSLRQDRVLAQHEAVERAQSLADDLVPRIWAEFITTNYPEPPGYHSFEVNAAGALEFPTPYAPVPIAAPFDEQHLTPEQRRLWQEAQKLETAASRPDAQHDAINAYRQFIALEPPKTFCAVAHYALGLLLGSAGKNQASADEFRLLLKQFPNAAAESGLLLKPLAQFKLLQVAASGKQVGLFTDSPAANDFFSNAVIYPTMLTPQFIESAAELVPLKEEAAKWNTLWQEHEFSRQLFAAASTHFGTNPTVAEITTSFLTARIWPFGHPFDPELAFFWFDGVNRSPELAGKPNDAKWLAIRMPSPAAGSPANPPGTNDNSRFSGGGKGVADIWYLQAVASLGDLQPTNSTAGQPKTTEKSNLPPTNLWFVCRSESDIRAGLNAVIKAMPHVPEYFGLGIQIAGKDYSYENPGSVGNQYPSDMSTNFLASAYCSSTTGFRSLPGPTGADWMKSSSGWDPIASTVRANVYLTNPSALFQRQRSRTLWFGGLIAVAAATALVGLTAAWRAFDRQQRLSDMKSNFVSSVSHELRAPIATVRLLAESLERGKVSDAQKQEEYFRFIGQECRRLSALVENVLDFSRIEQGRKQYEFEPTDIVSLVRATVALMQTYAVEKGVAVALDLQNLEGRTSQLELCVDGRAIQQALVNLVDNAIKHSPKGGEVTVGLGSVECRVSSEEAGPAPRHSKPDTQASLVTLFVQDHGPGIPLEEHEKIFERFYRVGPELRRETQGVGIGLSIVKHIVEAHGGRVVVRSAVGQGSRFTIELPHRAPPDLT